MKKKLLEYLEKIGNINYIITMLSFEMDTIAPKKSIDDLIKSKSIFELEYYKLSTSLEYIKLIEDLINSNEFNVLSEEEKRFINKSKEEYYKFKRIPESFYEEYNSFRSKSLETWVKSKESNDFGLFKPYLIKGIDYTKKLYNYMYPDKDNLYDLMLDTYEKGINTKIVDKLFSELKGKIKPIIDNLDNKEIEFKKEYYDTDKLKEISEFLLDYIGFDNNRGALGIYTHGYTTKLNNNDIRITFPKQNDIIDHVCTVIHEGGHGIFEQNLSDTLKEYKNYSIDSLALHESQSRFYENILGRNINFWIPIYDKVKSILDLDLDIDTFIGLLNNAHKSLIRTKADELTYCMHIIIRYEIEKEIFNNKIDLDNLDKVWNQKYKDYLGVDVTKDSEGILQDMHWASLDFGYFPTYLLGSIFDGMLYEHIDSKYNINDTLKKGNIKKITKYLNDNIHKYGCAYNVNEVSVRLFGKELEVDGIVKYFKDKYEKRHI